MSQMLQAVDQLNDRLVAADCIGQAFDLAGGEESPPWVHVFRCQIEAIREAAEVLETLVRRGIGGIAPDGDKVEASSGEVRGTGGGHHAPAIAP